MRFSSTLARNYSAACIFFHGSGDTGANLAEWVHSLLGRHFKFSHIKLIYPTAPLQAYTPMGGERTNVWFNRNSVSIEALEDRQSMARIYESVNELIAKELKEGLPMQRILVGGFSMGGTLAMHTGYHLYTNVGGVFACSAFLNRDSLVYESLQKRNMDTVLPELRMYHGDGDVVVPDEWGRESFEQLRKYGVKGEFILLNNTLHELMKQELLDIEEWILRKLPPT